MAARFEQAESMTLTELDQVRVLADPLRIRIIEVLCVDECTTKQVAERLGEKPTKLYHHVEALEKVGLIRQTRTRRNRGTLERYYLGVAKRFRADSSVFRSEEADGDMATKTALVETVLDSTKAELARLAKIDPVEITDEEAVMGFVEIHTTAKNTARIRKRVMRLLADIEKLETPDDEDEARTHRLQLAFYPLDRFPDES